MQWWNRRPGRSRSLVDAERTASGTRARVVGRRPERRGRSVLFAWMAAALVSAAGAANAAVLDYVLALEISLPNAGILQQVVASGSTNVTPSASGASFTLPQSLFTMPFTQGFVSTAPGSIRLSSGTNGAGSFSAGGGQGPGFGGSMALLRLLRASFTTFVMSQGTFTPVLTTLPISGSVIGGGGSIVTSALLGTSSTIVTFSLQGGLWTTQPVSNGSSASTGFDNRSTGGVGALQMVVPIRTSTSANQLAVGFAKLGVAFVPEPTRVASLAAGAIAVVVLGWWRRGRTR